MIKEQTPVSRKNVIGCIILAIIFVCCASVCTILSWASLNYFTNFSPNEVLSGDLFNQVGIIDINGEIIGGEVVDLFGGVMPDPVELIKSRLEQAAADDSVKAVILRLNTPGGTVFDSFEIADAVREFKEETDKPVIALVETSAASGGYLIASQADYIFSSSTSIVGSIGVIAQVQDPSGLLEKLGIEQVKITSDGAEQKAGSKITDPNSPEYKNIKELLNDYQKLFNQYVAEGRGLSEAEVKRLGNGSVSSGISAVSKKLVDEIGDLEAAVDKAQELGKFDQEPRVFTYGEQGEGLIGFPSILSRILPQSSLTRTRQGLQLYF